MLEQMRAALSMFVLLSVLTGVVYPLAVTAAGQALFPWQANGSLVRVSDRMVGSALIGQSFSSPGYFWGRPSATGEMPYDGRSSGGSNLGPLNPELHAAVAARIAILRAADPAQRSAVPVDLVTASGSGLDPDISLAAARFQTARVASARRLPVARVEQLVELHARHSWHAVLGAPRVNVLELNLALDRLR